MRNFARITSTLLATALCTSAAFATTYTQKTYLATRPAGVNLAMEYTTMNDQVYRSNKGREHRVHSHIQVTGFYQESTKGDKLGQYFGPGNCSSSCGSNCFQIGPATASEANPPTDVIDGRFLIHQANTGDNAANIAPLAPATLAGLVCLSPRQELWGARFDYYQDIVWGLYLKANLPVVNVSNDMRMKICNSVSETVDPTNASTTAATTFNLQDFFAGRVSVASTATDPHDQQCPLQKAKIGCGKRSKTGVADIDVALGYKVWDKEKSHLYLNLGVTIPTGNKPHGDYVFEPIYGNGGHVGFGAGFDAGWEFWSGKHADARLLFAANYRYLFKDEETRTLGVNSCNYPWNVLSAVSAPGLLNTNKPPKWMQYYLVAGDQQQNMAIQPAANRLTQSVEVTPGSQFDGIVDFNFKCHGFILDIGYNLFWKDEEEVKLRCSPCATSCNTSCETSCPTTCPTTCGVSCGETSSAANYGFVNPAYLTNTIFNETGGTASQLAIDGQFVNNNISTSAAETPSYLTNKIFAGLGYALDISEKYPWCLGLGGSYEFASNNAQIEAWSVWLKSGISF